MMFNDLLRKKTVNYVFEIPCIHIEREKERENFYSNYTYKKLPHRFILYIFIYTHIRPYDIIFVIIMEKLLVRFFFFVLVRKFQLRLN